MSSADAVHINDQTLFDLSETVEFVVGEGESIRRDRMSVLTDPDGHLYYLHKEGPQTFLYTTSWPDEKAEWDVITREVFPDNYSAIGDMQMRRPRLQWCRLEEACAREGLFFGTRQGLRLSNSSESRIFYAVGLLKVGENQFLTSNFPARQMPRALFSLERRTSRDRLSMLVFSVTGALLLWGGLGNSWSLSCFWCLAGLFTFAAEAQWALKLIATAGGLHFLTYTLDVHFWPQHLVFESLKITVLMLSLFLLRRQDGRLFESLQEATAVSFILSFGLGLIWSLFFWTIPDSGHINLYPQYMVSLPGIFFGWLFLLGFFVSGWGTISSSPVQLRPFCQQLLHLIGLLRSEPKSLAYRGRELARKVRALADGLKWTRDPSLLQIQLYASQLNQLEDVFLRLPLEPDEQTWEDLQVVAEDLDSLYQFLQKGDGPVFALRLSAHLFSRDHLK